MTPRALAALFLAPLLSLAAAPARAGDTVAPRPSAGQPQPPPDDAQPPGDARPPGDPPPEAVPPPPVADGRALDLSGRLRATADGLLLELGGARLELRAVDDGAPGELVEPVPGAHELSARFSVDGRTTGLLLRFVPPTGIDAPPR